MTKEYLKSLKNSENYPLQVFILQRPEFNGVQRKMDILNMRAGVFLADDYHYAEFDYIVMGVNPIINILFAALLEMKGKSVLVSTLRTQDAWDYNQLMSLHFQKKLALKFRTGFDFLKYKDPEERTMVFLDKFLEKMSTSFEKSVFISNSDIVISSDIRKINNQYLFKAQFGVYEDQLPFNTPKINGETLYNKVFNLFYKYYSERTNDWNFATDVEIQTKKPRFVSKMDEHAFYHILSSKVLITSHYHPYIQDNELSDDSVFKVIKETSIDDLDKWIDK